MGTRMNIYVPDCVRLVLDMLRDYGVTASAVLRCGLVVLALEDDSVPLRVLTKILIDGDDCSRIAAAVRAVVLRLEQGGYCDTEERTR